MFINYVYIYIHYVCVYIYMFINMYIYIYIYIMYHWRFRVGISTCTERILHSSGGWSPKIASQPGKTTFGTRG